MASRRVRSTLVRSEARAQLHWIAHNPEDRAVLGFLESYEPDLVSYAEARQIDPSLIPEAARKLDA